VADREAWAKFEAIREIDCGEPYTPLPLDELYIQGTEVLHHPKPVPVRPKPMPVETAPKTSADIERAGLNVANACARKKVVFGWLMPEDVERDIDVAMSSGMTAKEMMQEVMYAMGGAYHNPRSSRYRI
jgi:hypothetical protein